MKPFAVILVAFIVATRLVAAPPGENKGAEEMEKMKSLVGVWEGKDKDGNPVRVSYRLVSAGTSLMETIDHGEMKESMITVYHLDGDRMMMTHYCSMGNQPRMRLTNATPTSLSFSFVDATNLASKGAAHMHKLVITWTDKDHVNQEWTMRSEGKDSPPTVFKLQRKS